MSKSTSKVKDLTDQSFGKLTVLKRAENTKDGRSQWLCKCECGNTKVIKGKYLLNGDTKSCGCLKHSEPVIKEINIGTKVGRFTVIKQADKTIKGLPQWLCQCECGNTKIIPETSLKNKRILSCGCSKKASHIKAGDVFGRLTVIKFAGLTKEQNKLYLCQCECGRKKNVKGSNLVNGSTISCGNCIRWTKNKEIKTGDTFGKLTVIKRAKEKFTGKEKHIVKRWECQCRCGKTKTFSERALLCGDARSCGCSQYASRTKYVKQGTRFDHLTVIKDLGMIEKKYKTKTKREHYCLCMCDCGNIKEVPLKGLKDGTTKACGCRIFNKYKKKQPNKQASEINNNYEYKKTGIARIRRIFSNNNFISLSITDQFYKDFVSEHNDYEMFMIRKLDDDVKDLIRTVSPLKDFIIDSYLVSFSNTDIIYFNVMLNKNYKLNKDEINFPMRHRNSYTQAFLKGLMGNYCTFCNIISYPIYFKPNMDINKYS